MRAETIERRVALFLTSKVFIKYECERLQADQTARQHDQDEDTAPIGYEEDRYAGGCAKGEAGAVRPRQPRREPSHGARALRRTVILRDIQMGI